MGHFLQNVNACGSFLSIFILFLSENLLITIVRPVDYTV